MTREKKIKIPIILFIVYLLFVSIKIPSPADGGNNRQHEKKRFSEWIFKNYAEF